MALVSMPLPGEYAHVSRPASQHPGPAGPAPVERFPVHACSPSMPSTAADSVARDGATSDVAPRPVSRPAPRDGMRDFDFLHGRWRVHNRRLRRPLSGSGEWYEFEGTAVERPLWDGQGNLEEYEAELPTGDRLRGLALRLYDPRSRQWTINWSSSATGRLDRPMTGEFRDGRGEFYNQEELEGRAIYVRFIWTSLGPAACRWEQAFSADGGRTWETNWIMDFTRAP